VPYARQLNVPNSLTLFRIFLVPILVTIILTKFEGKEWIGVGVFLLAAFTDFVDGWLARRWRQVTPLGKLLDPMADKLLIAGAFISLIEVGGVPSWMVVVIIAREFAVTGLRGIAAERGVTIAASWFGKIKMTVQVACVCVLLLSRPHAAEGDLTEIATPFAKAFLWATIAVTVASGIEYFYGFRKVLEMPTEDGDSHS
jgi:CDP-diacylglycerol--glycerol-3-phosphate 3-phosphatidyltransferase